MLDGTAERSRVTKNAIVYLNVSTVRQTHEGEAAARPQHHVTSVFQRLALCEQKSESLLHRDTLARELRGRAKECSCCCCTLDMSLHAKSQRRLCIKYKSATNR